MKRLSIILVLCITLLTACVPAPTPASTALPTSTLTPIFTALPTLTATAPLTPAPIAEPTQVPTEIPTVAPTLASGEYLLDGIDMHLLRAEYHSGAFKYYPPVLEKDGKKYTFNGSVSTGFPGNGNKTFELTFQSDNPDMSDYTYGDAFSTSIIKFKTDKGVYNCKILKDDENVFDCGIYKSDKKNTFPAGFLTIIISMPKDETITSVTIKKNIVHGDVNVIYDSSK